MCWGPYRQQEHLNKETDMAFDLKQLEASAQIANAAASRYLLRLQRFINAKTEEGVALNAAQRDAIKTAAAADADTLAAAAAAIKAQHDANP